jgi:hypothetical protein
VQIYAMNFFSHYYLDKENADKWFLFGTLLPELLPHFNEKMRKAVNSHPPIEPFDSIYNGIQRHYEVDSRFHNSEFFKTHTAKIKNAILQNQHLEPLHYRTYYLAHIWLELLIDRIIINDSGGQEAGQFYGFLETIDTAVVEAYFIEIGKKEMFPVFINILNRHRELKFLFYYFDNEKFTGALLRLYSSVNPSIFDTMPIQDLTKLLLFLERELQSETLKFVHDFKSLLNPQSAR